MAEGFDVKYLQNEGDSQFTTVFRITFGHYPMTIIAQNSISL